MRRLLLAAAAVLVLTGCNTLIQKQYQKITVHTPGLENVDCILETEMDKYRILAPGIARVERSDLPMTITCQKVNYVTAVKTFDSKIRMKHSQFNVFNGIVPGTAYDVASNSIYAYPDDILIEMKPVSEAFVPSVKKQKALPAVRKKAPAPSSVDSSGK